MSDNYDKILKAVEGTNNSLQVIIADLAKIPKGSDDAVLKTLGGNWMQLLGAIESYGADVEDTENELSDMPGEFKNILDKNNRELRTIYDEFVRDMFDVLYRIKGIQSQNRTLQTGRTEPTDIRLLNTIPPLSSGNMSSIVPLMLSPANNNGISNPELMLPQPNIGTSGAMLQVANSRRNEDVNSIIENTRGTQLMLPQSSRAMLPVPHRSTVNSNRSVATPGDNIVHTPQVIMSPAANRSERRDSYSVIRNISRPIDITPVNSGSDSRTGNRSGISRAFGGMRRGVGKAFGGIKGGLGKALGGIGGGMLKANPYVMAASKVAGVMYDAGKAVVDATMKYDKYNDTLQRTFRDTTKAGNAMDMLKDFATDTPFQIDELTGSFSQLTKDGVGPTKAQMKSLGNVASYNGLSFSDMTKALVAAESGKVDSLSALGVKAKVNGDKISVVFKGQKKEIENTAAGIRKYVTELGNMPGVAGSMAAANDTIGASIQNLGESWTGMLASIGDGRMGPLQSVLDGLGNGLNSIGEWFEIPVSDKIMEEKAEINGLVSAIIALNEGDSMRLDLLNQLQQKYPDVIDAIDLEKLSNEQLAESLKRVNGEYERKYNSQKANEERAEEQEEIDELKQELLEVNTARGIKARMSQLNEELFKKAGGKWQEGVMTKDGFRSSYVNQKVVGSAEYEEYNKLQEQLNDLGLGYRFGLVDFDKKIKSIQAEISKHEEKQKDITNVEQLGRRSSVFEDAKDLGIDVTDDKNGNYARLFGQDKTLYDKFDKIVKEDYNNLDDTEFKFLEEILSGKLVKSQKSKKEVLDKSSKVDASVFKGNKKVKEEYINLKKQSVYELDDKETKRLKEILSMPSAQKSLNSKKGKTGNENSSLTGSETSRVNNGPLEVASGGSRATHINTTVQKLVESIVINAQGKDMGYIKENIQATVEEALLRALNSANAMAN